MQVIVTFSDYTPNYVCLLNIHVRCLADKYGRRTIKWSYNVDSFRQRLRINNIFSVWPITQWSRNVMKSVTSGLLLLPISIWDKCSSTQD